MCPIMCARELETNYILDVKDQSLTVHLFRPVNLITCSHKSRLPPIVAAMCMKLPGGASKVPHKHSYTVFFGGTGGECQFWSQIQNQPQC